MKIKYLSWPYSSVGLFDLAHSFLKLTQTFVSRAATMYQNNTLTKLTVVSEKPFLFGVYSSQKEAWLIAVCSLSTLCW